MFNGGGFHMGGMHGLWWIFWLVLVCVFLFFVRGRPSEKRRNPSDTPHEVLQRRLANGEITPEEYEKRKELLDRDAGMKT